MTTVVAMKILVVEDTACIRRVLVSSLAQHYTVDEASDGAAGLELALSRAYDVVVTDVNMPKMSGQAMARALRDLDNPPKLLAVTTEVLDGWPFDAVLHKPVSKDELLRGVAALVL